MKNKLLIIGLSMATCACIFTGCSDSSNDKNKYVSTTNNVGTIATVVDDTKLKTNRIMEDGSYQIRFSDLVSLDALKEYNDKEVTAIGYLSPISSYDGSFSYLMNLPYQTCPYCQPNDTKIANTLAIFAKKGEKIEFTESAVVVKGILKLEDYTDDYGYTYGYRIVDATYELADTTELGEKITLYNEIADKKILTGIMDTLYSVDANVYYDEYVANGEDYTPEVIDSAALDEVINNLKTFDESKVKILISVSNDLKELLDATNKLIEDNQLDQLANYKTDDDNLFNSINEWMAEYQL